MILNFVTTNKHKFEEAQQILNAFGVRLKQLDIEYEENHDTDIEEIAVCAARKLSGELGVPLVVEDTGLYFNAYPKFPGALPKFVFDCLGYRGIFKLLAREDRKAYFKTVVAYCEPGGQPVRFSGIMRGELTEKVFNEDLDAMPYDRIFIPAGERVTVSDMSLKKKNSYSQRGKAFNQLGKYLAKKS
jgi:non-canonical purine NTP pyrophosphatase (RdgB/HAM1 family)